MSAKPKFNPYEFSARTLKVHALVETIRAELAKHGIQASVQVAELLRASWAAKTTDDFAAMAKVRRPSIKTWDLVCEELKR